MAVRRFIVFLLAALPAVSCTNGEDATVDDAGADADSDADADTDTDVDTQSDADTDTDSDTCPAYDYEVVDVSAGGFHTCVVLEGGGVKCWGNNQYGQLGYNYWESECTGSTPDTCPLLDSVVPALQIAAAGYHTCALLAGGSIGCWGYNGGGGFPNCTGNLGPVSGGPFVQISSMSGSSSALTTGGDVISWGCWGVPEPQQMYPQPGFAGAVIEVTTGSRHHCALMQSGDVYCWGFNHQGQLGYGHMEFVAAADVPGGAGPVDLGRPAVQVSAGGSHTCAILEGGDVICWGWGAWGQLGYGNDENIGDDEVPADAGFVDIGGAAIQISAGTFSTCAIRDDANAFCWGAGGSIPLGYGNTEFVGDDESPVDVGPLDIGGPVRRISAGYAHFCAILETGRVRCWGSGGSGRLGYGNDENIGDDEVPATACDVPVM